jgi:hypothetical protein
VLAVTSFSVEHWLKCVLLLASITLTGVTIWFKVKKNGGDK